MGSSTLLGWVLTEARASRALDEVIVVLGGAAAEVRRRVDLASVKAVENPDFGEGCAASYRTGLAAIHPQAEAVAVLLGDQPGANRSVIDTVVEGWRQTRDRIMLASYRGQHGHPLVFAQALFAQLAGLHGDKAAWKIVDAHRDSIVTVPLDRPAPRDVNTWQEYQALVREGS